MLESSSEEYKRNAWWETAFDRCDLHAIGCREVMDLVSILVNRNLSVCMCFSWTKDLRLEFQCRRVEFS